MRIILRIIASILSLGGGVLFVYYFIMFLLSLSNGNSFVIIDTPKSQIFLCLVLILLPFIVAVYILKKKKQHAVKKIIIISFVASFVMTFILFPYQSAIIDFFRTPSNHVQSEIQSQVQHIIDEQHLPYVIDQKESESWTDDEVIRTVVYLNKTLPGELKKEEVKPFLGTTFETNVLLVFNDKREGELFKIIIDKGEESSCTDESYCE